MKTLRSFGRLPTEQPNPVSRELDRLSAAQLARLMNQQDSFVGKAVRRVLPNVARAVDLIAGSLKRKGRLFLLGAGTSGRLCVMEAAECPPTFNTPPEMVQAFIAGGPKAVFRSQEGAEDRGWEAEALVRKHVSARDIVVGVAASGVTPFVLVGLDAARRKRARTILVTCNPHSSLKTLANVVIAPSVGPEVLTGSTRLKAGTATKLILNMLTTISMTRLGKVYRHWMVDLQPRSNKLQARGIRLIQHLGQVSEEQAKQIFEHADGRVKTAILMARKGLSRRAAEEALKRSNGFLRKALL